MFLMNTEDSPAPDTETSIAIALRKRMRDLGYSQADVARAVGKSQGWVSQYLFSVPRKTLLKLNLDDLPTFKRMVEGLLDLFKWTPFDFTEATGFKIPDISYMEGIILDPSESREEAWARMWKEEPAQVREITNRRTRQIPKYRTVSAGPGLDDGELLGYIDIPVEQSGDVAYEVDGHSMEPDIRSGDTVIVKRGVFSLGDVVVAYVPNSGMVIKRLTVDSEEKRVILKSKNPDYGQLIAEGADIKGKVVEVRRRL